MPVPIIHAERRIVRRLKDEGASTPERAQPVVPRRLVERRALERLVASRAVLHAAGERYYVDLVAYRAHRHRQRKRALIALAAFALLFLLLTLAGVIPLSTVPQ